MPADSGYAERSAVCKLKLYAITRDGVIVLERNPETEFFWRPQPVLKAGWVRKVPEPPPHVCEKPSAPNIYSQDIQPGAIWRCSCGEQFEFVSVVVDINDRFDGGTTQWKSVAYSARVE